MACVGQQQQQSERAWNEEQAQRRGTAVLEARGKHVQGSGWARGCTARRARGYDVGAGWEALAGMGAAGKNRSFEGSIKTAGLARRARQDGSVRACCMHAGAVRRAAGAGQRGWELGLKPQTSVKSFCAVGIKRGRGRAMQAS